MSMLIAVSAFNGSAGFVGDVPVLPNGISYANSALWIGSTTSSTSSPASNPPVTHIDNAFAGGDDGFAVRTLTTGQTCTVDFANESTIGSESVTGVTIESYMAYGLGAVQGSPFSITCELLIGGVSKGTETITSGLVAPGSTAPFTMTAKTWNNAGWDSAWSQGERDAAQVRFTLVTAVKSNQMFIDLVNIVWTV